MEKSPLTQQPRPEAFQQKIVQLYEELFKVCAPWPSPSPPSLLPYLLLLPLGPPETDADSTCAQIGLTSTLPNPSPTADETNPRGLIPKGRPRCRERRALRGLLARVLPAQAGPRVPPAPPRRPLPRRPAADGGADQGAVLAVREDAPGRAGRGGPAWARCMTLARGTSLSPSLLSQDHNFLSGPCLSASVGESCFGRGC